MRIHKVNQNYLFGAGGVMLAGILGAMLFPAMPEGAHAEDVSQSAGTKVNLTVQPVIAVSAADNAVSVDVTPTQGGTFEKNATTLSVSTNNETGYSLYLSTVNGKSTLASLNPSVTNTIGAVSGTAENPVSKDGFGANTWGYNLGKDAATDSTTYQAVPTTTTAPQATTAGPTLGDGTLAADTYNLNFGALINSDLPSGTYTNTVTVSVVTNPAYIPPFEGIQTMQEMTSSICSNADEGETARLKDTRDDKLYWVTKLKDGNCWMTQNLDFDIPAGGITGDQAAKTDLLDGTAWDSSSDYAPQPTITDSPFNNSTSTGTYSYDPGLYVNDPSKGWTACDTYYEDTSACTAGNWTKITDSMSPMTTERTDGTVVDGDTYEPLSMVTPMTLTTSLATTISSMPPPLVPVPASPISMMTPPAPSAPKAGVSPLVVIVTTQMTSMLLLPATALLLVLLFPKLLITSSQLVTSTPTR